MSSTEERRRGSSEPLSSPSQSDRESRYLPHRISGSNGAESRVTLHSDSSRRSYHHDTSPRRSRSPAAGTSSDVEPLRRETSSPGSSSSASYMYRKRPFISPPREPRAHRRRRFDPPTPPADSIPSSPTTSYLTDSLIPSTVLADPCESRKLLILDLNGTLVLRAPYKSPPRDPYYNPYADPYKPRPLRTVLPRPFLSSFREYLFHPKTKEWLDTMIWSSAQPHSVEDMVKRAFCDHIEHSPNVFKSEEVTPGSQSVGDRPQPSARNKDDPVRKGDLIAVWARDTLGLDKESYFQNAQTTKNLEKPWDWLKNLHDNDRSLPGNVKPTLHSSYSTLLLDDSTLKARLQPYNHVCVKEYTTAMRAIDVDSVSKHGDEQVTEASPARELFCYEGYDVTLLAVVGVLDAVKVESNVAAWVRSGGLFSGKSDSAGASTEDFVIGSGNDESNLGVSVSHVHGDNKTHRVEVGMWSEDSSNMRYWAERGSKALKELGIEVVVGVVPSTDEMAVLGKKGEVEVDW